MNDAATLPDDAQDDGAQDDGVQDDGVQGDAAHDEAALTESAEDDAALRELELRRAALRDGTLRDLVGAYVSEQITVLIDAEAPLRERENIVHPTRVAVRRLRSTIRVFEDLFDPEAAAALEAELYWWAGVLGAPRDLDVLGKRLKQEIKRLPPELVLGPVASQIASVLALDHKTAFDEAIATLDTPRYRSLVGLLHTWRSDAPWTPLADEPAKKVTRHLKKANKKVKSRLRIAVEAMRAGEPEADELMHSGRKAGKRHRYAAELALPVLGEKGEQVIADRKRLQDVLGDHQDSTVAAIFLRDMGARYGLRSGQNGFTYGLLYAREQAIRDRVLDDLESVQ